MRIVKWCLDNSLFIISLFLLAFIPLYPKFPLLDVPHTWVYVRLEDFLVAAVAALLFVKLMRRRASVKTPLTMPILIFWAVGAVSTIFAILFIFPTLANQFPNVAIFHFLRKIEYLSVFFVAFSSIRDKKHIHYVIAVLSITLLSIVIYGLGQKSFNYEFELLGKTFSFGWPQVFFAYSTMNEEFAKGIPLRLSEYARVPSTFAGHYDLGAYLVLLIPIMGSLVFGFKRWYAKFFFFFCAFAGLVLLLLTASRVSFAVYVATISFMLILQKQKKFIIPVIALSILLLNSFQGISQRFGSTISQVDVVVDARTGKPIGIAKQVSKKTAAEAKPVVIEEIQSTGENLPQGSGYINLPSESASKTITQVLYKRLRIKAGTQSAEITTVQGDFVVKRALAYDVSFTTRFQGEWPRAYEAFKRNILLGSGYSSISLATDNNYLRILGETGVLGLGSFVLIFIIMGIYTYRVLGEVDSRGVRSFTLGLIAGTFGLGLNAILIDVFEASKVAFVLWLLVGFCLGLLHLYQRRRIEYLGELRRFFLSVPLIILYLFIATFMLFSISFQNYFVADDFTWLRWVADCKKTLYQSGLTRCEPVSTTITNFFRNSDGFFFRPGTKLYFFVMYSIFWLNHVAYHVMSVFFHFLATSLVFILALKILKSKFFAFICSIFFLLLSSHSEAVFWISSTGHLISSVSVLFGLLFFIIWKESKHWLFGLFSLLSIVFSMLFYELGIVGPLLILAYDFITDTKLTLSTEITWGRILRRWYYLLYLLPIPFYLAARYFAKSHWLSGDYSYNFAYLPYNIFGNLIGYITLALFGAGSLSYYQDLREFVRGNAVYALVGLAFSIGGLFLFSKLLLKKLSTRDRQIILVSIILFLISLLPFLGLGNISMRYIYLASFGIVLLLVFLIKKIYDYQVLKNALFASLVVGLILLTFSTFHFIGLYNANNDWSKAGSITNKLLVSFNDTFSKRRAYAINPVFYFSNVPIRRGEAWVFPVGLPDALWFTFQNENLTVHVEKSLDFALDQAEGSSSAKVFEFDKDGNAAEVIRTRNTITVPIEKKR